ncbi:MAG: PolC-type DNA polymerase III [Bacillota bacterium]
MFVIKPGSAYSKDIKFIVINQKTESCYLICEQQPAEKYGGLLENTPIAAYEKEVITDLSLETQINFIWPQLIREFSQRFNFGSSWLERARLHLEQECLRIEMETKMASKRLNTERIRNFLAARLFYYIDEEIEIKLSNGDFLEDVSVEPEVNQVSGNKGRGKQPPSLQKQVVFGRQVSRAPTHKLSEIHSKKDKVVIKGEVFKYEEKQTRNGNLLVLFSLTDHSSSIGGKLFLQDRDKLNTDLEEGDWVMLEGRVNYDNYSNELVVVPDNISKIPPETREDKADRKRIELHLHTQMSALDATLSIEEAVRTASEWGHPALAVTDHGVVQSFPEAFEAGQKYGVDIIYGLEAYMVDDGEPIVINPDSRPLAELEFVVFDLETTGLNPHACEIIEIGAVKLSGEEVIDEFSSFVCPQGGIPGEITELTGIDQTMVQGAPKIGEVMDDFLEFIGDGVLVAHNAGFDYGFLRANLKQEPEIPIIDTLGLSRALISGLNNYKLNTLARHFNIDLEDHHRALDDARATAGIFQSLLSDIREQDLSQLEEINDLSTDIDWRQLRPYHTIILARNKQGIKDLYRLVSSSHLEYFYRKPRILKSQLINNREHLIIGSACESGQLFRALIQNKSDREIEDIAGFYDYLELQPLGNNQFLIPDQVDSEEELRQLNKRIYQLGAKLDKPVVATGDVHFLDPENDIFRQVLQAGQGFDDADNQPPLYFRTTDDMLEEFSYLGREVAREVVVDNPWQLYQEIEPARPIPEGLYTPRIEGAADRVREMTYKRARNLYGDPLPERVDRRLEKELESIIDNGYAVIYLISHKLVKKSLEDGYLVGSRGSVGSSLVATMCEITEVNPLPPHYRCPECQRVEFVEKEGIGGGVDLGDKDCPDCGTPYLKDGFDIPFEVFLGFEGDKVPDIDLNFSGEYQGEIHQQTEELFGRDYVFRAGTISTIANRTAFGFVRGFMEENNLDLRQAEVNRLVRGCAGVRRTTGQHPGGLMVVPRNRDVHDFTPIQHPANDQETGVRTTHFDYHSISGRILKLDLLGHDDPTTLRILEDRTGVKPGQIPLDDPETMSIFSSPEALGLDPDTDELGARVGTLGIPEFGTGFVRQMLVDTRPETFAELVRISGLSHGTDVWLNNAQELIREGTASLSEVISVRDDIMNYLIQKGLEPGRAFWIMEHVRKGKGLTEEEESYMREFEVPDWYIQSCKKIKYMFPKAHAVAYVTMAFRIAYFKVHYPEAFYATYFTIKAHDFDAHMVSKGYEFICEKRRELRHSDDLTAKDKAVLTNLEIVIEARLRGIEFTPVDLYQSQAYEFTTSSQGLLPPLICLKGLGDSAAESIIEARKQGEFRSVEDLVKRTGATKTVIEILRKHGALEELPEKNQLALF